MLDARQSLQGEPDRHAVGAGLALQKFDQGHTPIARPIRTRSQHAIALADALFHIIKYVKHGVFLQAQADFEVGGRVMNRWEEMSIDSFAEVLWKPGAAVGRLARASVAHLGDGVLRAKLLFHEADCLRIGADGAEGETLQADARECLLVLRELFQLPYRQTEWLAKSLVQLMRVTIDIPDYMSLAKRAGKLGVALDVRRRQGPVDVVVDSTGLKVFGEGEWKTRKHGISKRHTWRKLRLAVNPDTHERSGNVDGKLLRRRRPSGRPSGASIGRDHWVLWRRRLRQMEGLRNAGPSEDPSHYPATAKRENQAARQFERSSVGAGHRNPRNPPSWSPTMENTHRLSSPQPFGNGHVSHEMLLWRPSEKPSDRKPTNRSKIAK